MGCGRLLIIGNLLILRCGENAKYATFPTSSYVEFTLHCKVETALCYARRARLYARGTLQRSCLRRYTPSMARRYRGLAFGRIMDDMSGCIPTGPFDVPWACAVCGKKGHLAVDDELTLAGMFDLLSQQHDHDNLFSGAVLTFHIEIEIRAETLRSGV